MHHYAMLFATLYNFTQPHTAPIAALCNPLQLTHHSSCSPMCQPSTAHSALLMQPHVPTLYSSLSTPRAAPCANPLQLTQHSSCRPMCQPSTAHSALLVQPYVPTLYSSLSTVTCRGSHKAVYLHKECCGESCS